MSWLVVKGNAKGSVMWGSLYEQLYEDRIGSVKQVDRPVLPFHTQSLADLDFSTTQPSFLCSQILMPKIPIPELNP